MTKMVLSVKTPLLAEHSPLKWFKKWKFFRFVALFIISEMIR